MEVSSVFFLFRCCRLLEKFLSKLTIVKLYLFNFFSMEKEINEHPQCMIIVYLTHNTHSFLFSIIKICKLAIAHEK